jgi:subtilisin family serine protease
MYHFINEPKESGPKVTVAHAAGIGANVRPGRQTVSTVRSWGPVIRLAILLLLAALPGHAAAQSSQIDTNLTPGSFSDMIAVQDEKYGTTIYLADAETGAIYVKTVSPKDPSVLKLNGFRLFFKSSEFRRPTAIAYRDGKLFVCDSGIPAVIELNVTSPRPKVLWQGKPLQNPTSIAVSAGGSIAVADTGSRSMFLLAGASHASNANNANIQRPSQTAAGIREVKSFASPVRLVSNGYGFLVLDQKEGTVFEVVEGDKSWEVQTRAGSLRSVVMKATSENFAIKDFAFYKGILYLTDQKRIVTCVQNTGDILPVFINNSDQTHASRILITEDRMFVADASHNTILNLPRQVSVSINFDTDVPKSNQALVSLYQYLFSQGTLPRRQYVADRYYETLEQFLLDKNGLILGFSDKESDHPTRVNPTRTSLEELICKLNSDLCDHSDKLPSVVGLDTTDNHPLARKVVAGDRVILPDISIKSSITTSKVDLGGRKVSAYLAERIPWASDRAKIDASYFARINAALSKTLEGELSRYAFIAATPRQTLEPGTILRIEKGQELATGNVRKCNIPLQDKGENITLAETLFSAASEDYLPRRGTRRQARIDLTKLGVETIEIHFDKAVTESLDRTALGQSFSRTEVRQCMQEFSGAGQYLVIDALKVSGARYKLLGKGGLPVALSEDDLKRWDLLGQTDSEGRWSLIVTAPFYIGYRVALWGKQSTGNWEVITDPSKVKPGSSQDFLSLRSGSFNLPLTRWQLTVLVNVDDLHDEKSDLKKLEITYPGVRILSLEELPTKGAVSPNGLRPVSPQDTLETVEQNRKKLKADIAYPARETSGRGIIIGVGEKGTSVDRRHPDFIVDNRSAWLRAGENSAAEPEPTSASEAQPAERTIKQFNTDLDHGTHIAGLLAAREKSLTPGLVPAAELFLVDYASAATLQQSIQDAIGRGVFLFNFSFTLPGDAQTNNALRNLKIDIRDNWKDQLFVVAAGNESSDLKDNEVLPIRWVGEDVKNIIGVGASKGREDFLDNWVDRDGIIRQGSNYSKKHLQLVAPGLHIYSTTPNNSYAEATGTSQAVPQVTAAAAMLWAKGITQPLRIKARLIYTADWFTSFQNKVWGGLLNVSRALREPNRNLLSTQSNPQKIKALLWSGTPPAIRVIAGQIDDPGDAAPARPLMIPFQKILRISRLANGSFRVFYLDGTTLRILMNAELEGTVPCDEFLEWDPESEIFKETDASRSECRLGISVSQIFDYVAKVPPSVNF